MYRSCAARATGAALRHGAHVAGAGTHAPDASHAITYGRMHAGQVSHAAPHAFPRHAACGEHVNAPTVSHWRRESHAVGAKVGTGQVAGSWPGGQ
jgi:hypothetical protein